MRSEIAKAITREVSKHPGVELVFERRSRHYQAVMRFGKKQMRCTFPMSPSDHRVLKNAIGDVRRTLRLIHSQVTESEASPR